ncbi:MAG: dephospho-CoA kinase [Planctomycetota bacterium]
MQLIGLLGGVASGKSTVAGMLAELGAAALDADRFAHEALADPEVVASLRERWGEGLFDESGAMVRRRLAEKVFGDGPEQRAGREFLEGLVHPRVRQRLKLELADLAAAGQTVAVLDIPLLIEAGWADECHELLFVDTPREKRLARAADRGWDAGELAEREQAQVSIDEKRRRATAVVVNSGDLGELRRQVTEFWSGRFPTS